MMTSHMGGQVAVFYTCDFCGRVDIGHIHCSFSDVRSLVTYWSHWYISCVFWWSPVWSLCMCITREDLANTTKVSHHVCALFLACPLPWMGHLGGWTGTGKVFSPGLYIDMSLCKSIKLIMHCKVICLWCISGLGGPD